MIQQDVFALQKREITFWRKNPEVLTGDENRVLNVWILDEAMLSLEALHCNEYLPW